MEEMVTIATERLGDADLLKTYLESRGITVFLSSEPSGTFGLHFGGTGGVKAVDIKVPRAQAEDALALLKDAEGEKHRG